MNATYTIAVEAKESLLKLVEKSNRKATKLGMPVIKAEFGQEFVELVVRRGRPTGRSTKKVSVTLVGENPRLNGYHLTAIVSPLKGDDGRVMPVITTVPGEVFAHGKSIDDALRCDHCKLRRDRLETFIVTHEDGSWKQVARNCLTDFVGGNGCDFDSIARLVGLRSNLEKEISELGNKESRQFSSDSLASIFAFTIASIREHGWVSKKEAYSTGKVATATRVSDAMDCIANAPEDKVAEYLTHYYGRLTPASLPTEADFAKGEETLGTLQVLLDKAEEEGKVQASDYLYALRVLTMARTANKRTFGIAVSGVSFVTRELQGPGPETLSTRYAKALKTSKHVGVAGDKLEAKVTVVNSHNTSTGLVVLTFLTDGNDILTWFTGSRPEGLVDGQTYTMKATVRGHGGYKGTAQTLINRASFKA